MEWLTENRNRQVPAKKYKQVKFAVIAMLGVGTAFSAYSLLPQTEVDFTIGGKGFTEQYIIAGLLSAELEAAGFSVDQRLGMGTEVVYSATSNDTVDVYLEYTGTVWANIMNNDNNPGHEAVLAGVTDFVEDEEGMINIGVLGFQNRYVLAMRKDRAAELGVTSIEDLIPIAEDLVAAGDLEFFGRPEWITLRDTYNIDFAEKLTFDPTLMYTAINERQVDLIAGYTSDGRISAYDLLLLEDPRNALLPYDSFLIASSAAVENQLFTETLEALVNEISDDEMRQANRIVDVDGGSVSDAVVYLQSVIN